MNLSSYIKSFFNKKSKQYLVFRVLDDQKWHCRNHEYRRIKTGQLAGSGGIKGLKNGGSSRAGIVIESVQRPCTKCGTTTRHDRWNGNFTEVSYYTNIPQSLLKRIYSVLHKKDVVDNATRPLSQITIDHKLPKIRWNKQSEKKQTDYDNMTDDEIRDRFQLLKKSNGAVSHNLLKSRACESCHKTGHRGEPFGIRYFYSGNHRWEGIDKQDPDGCIGCGWYDIVAWRDSLNRKLNG